MAQVLFTIKEPDMTAIEVIETIAAGLTQLRLDKGSFVGDFTFLMKIPSERAEHVEAAARRMELDIELVK